MRRVAVVLMLAFASASLTWAPPVTTTVAWTVISPSGVPATSGTVSVILSVVGAAREDITLLPIVARQSAAIAGDGSVSFDLAPNETIDPAGSHYIFMFRVLTPTAGTWIEHRTVPASGSTIALVDCPLWGSPAAPTPLTSVLIDSLPLDACSGINFAGVTVSGNYNAATGSCDINVNAASTADGLGQFASTPSADLASVLSDETGTGLACFNTAPNFVNPVTFEDPAGHFKASFDWTGGQDTAFTLPDPGVSTDTIMTTATNPLAGAMAWDGTVIAVPDSGGTPYGPTGLQLLSDDASHGTKVLTITQGMLGVVTINEYSTSQAPQFVFSGSGAAVASPLLSVSGNIGATNFSGTHSGASSGTNTGDVPASDTAYASSWNGVTTVSASKNAVYDILHVGDTDDDGKPDRLDTATNGFVVTTGGTGAFTIDTSVYITAAGVPAAETDAAHDTCAEISGCVVGAITSYTETDPIVKAITGIVKSNGATISAASAGTDYVVPAGNVATASALAISPAQCSSNQWATGVDTQANATCSAISGGAGIVNGTVVLADLADVAPSTVFYRKTAATGVPEVQTLATLKTDLGLTGTNSGDQTITLTGNVTGSGTGSFAATIATAAVTLAKMADLAQDQFIGRVTGSTGVPETATITAAARTVLDDTTVSAMVDTLGGAAATGTGALARKDGATLTGAVVLPVTATISTYAVGRGTQTEIDFGSTPVRSTKFTISNTSVVAGTKVMAAIAYEAPTGRTIDEVEMEFDRVMVTAGNVVAATGFDIYVGSSTGMLSGKYKINYSLF